MESSLTLRQRKVLQNGELTFSRSLPFSEYDALVLLKPYIMSNLKLADLEIMSCEDALKKIENEGESKGLSKERVETAEPGDPGLQFWNA